MNPVNVAHVTLSLGNRVQVAPFTLCVGVSVQEECFGMQRVRAKLQYQHKSGVTTTATTVLLSVEHV